MRQETPEYGVGLPALEGEQTSPMCPLGAYLTDAAHATLASLAGQRTVRVDIVWGPPWCPEPMSDAGRIQLGC